MTLRLFRRVFIELSFLIYIAGAAKRRQEGEVSDGLTGNNIYKN